MNGAGRHIPAGLTVQGLSAAHGATTILDGVDLSVGEQALACVLGPSGSGKTTLLRVVAGFHRAAGGQVAVKGRIVDDGAGTYVPAERRRVGYIPQEGALFPHLSVAANIGFGLPRRQRPHRVAELLDLIGMSALADRHPHQLSGGQRQRVALARALAPQPELLLLDEPFAALDATLRTQVRADVVRLLRLAGATAILVTHDPDEALSFADTIAVMREGHIAQVGTPEDLYRQPIDAPTALALGEANLMPATLVGEQAVTAFGTLPLVAPGPRHGPGVVLVRPGQIRVSGSPETGLVRARVLAREFRGQDHRLELALEYPAAPSGRVIAYTSSVDAATAESVYLSVDGPTHALSGVVVCGDPSP